MLLVVSPQPQVFSPFLLAPEKFHWGFPLSPWDFPTHQGLVQAAHGQKHGRTVGQGSIKVLGHRLVELDPTAHPGSPLGPKASRVPRLGSKAMETYGNGEPKANPRHFSGDMTMKYGFWTVLGS